MITVSAIIPTFNRRDYIRRAVDSVLEQTPAVDEVIVVDDGSTDGSADLVEATYGSRVRVIRQARGGVSAARRRALREAHGEWVAFLDSDDEWTPGRNEQLLKAAVLVPAQVAWIFGDLRVVTDLGDGQTLFDEFGFVVSGGLEVLPDPLRILHPLHHPMFQGSLIRRNVLLELNCFSEGLQNSEDVLAALQVASRYKFAAIPSIVGRYYRTSDLMASSLYTNLLVDLNKQRTGLPNALGGGHAPDYFRARMIGYGVLAASGRREPWATRHAEQVRGLCAALASTSAVPLTLPLQQFRFAGISVKGIAFLFAAMFGRKGIHAWKALANCRRKVQHAATASTAPNDVAVSGAYAKTARRT